MEKTAKNEFDETAVEAMGFLLEQFWILREDEPEKYQMVRDRERVLRNYFLDKMGLRLIVHRYFAKLEKIPVEPQAWMGIQQFQQPRDYVFFCLTMAFLEGKTVDEQFLLSELCEELASLYEQKEALDWTHYERRKSLVRALQKATELGLLKVVDGDIADFNFNQDQEVLYEVPVVSRYFMRSYPKDLFQFQNKEEILEAEWPDQEQMSPQRRRYGIYRRLYLAPVIYSDETAEADLRYLRNFRNRISEDIERHSHFQFELYKNAALLTMPERKAMYTLFPDNKAISDIVLQFASLVREQREKDEIPLQVDGSLRLTFVDFERWVKLLKEQYGSGWSKQYREATITQLARELFQVLEDWQMATRDPDTGALALKPLLVRLCGKYPDDYLSKEQQGGETIDA